MNEPKDLNNIPKKEIEITDQNIKFYRMIMSGISIIDAYKGAGYKGTSPDAPYALYSSLKKRLLALQEADSNINALQLRKQLGDILSLPLSSKEITIKDKLNAIKLTHDIVESSKQMDNPVITAFVLHRSEPKDVVEVEESKDSGQTESSS